MACVRRPMERWWVGRRGWYQLPGAGGVSKRVVTGSVRNRVNQIDAEVSEAWIRDDRYSKAAGARAYCPPWPSNGISLEPRNPWPPACKYLMHVRIGYSLRKSLDFFFKDIFEFIQTRKLIFIYFFFANINFINKDQTILNYYKGFCLKLMTYFNLF